MGYTKNEIISEVKKAAESNISLFYTEDFINYRGKTTDTNELYTEVVAGWMIENISVFDGIKNITRESSYKTLRLADTDNKVSNRQEEIIAKQMSKQGQLGILGDVIDYQTPLKNKIDDKAGKIDLLAYDGDTLRILELKKPDSKETMLRCVIEGYTYLKTVDTQKILSDFDLPANTKVNACPLVFKNKEQYTEMQEDRPNLKKLMKLLDSEPFYVTKVDEKYFVEE